VTNITLFLAFCCTNNKKRERNKKKERKKEKEGKANGKKMKGGTNMAHLVPIWVLGDVNENQ